MIQASVDVHVEADLSSDSADETPQPPVTLIKV